jgi:hypothetical protein
VLAGRRGLWPPESLKCSTWRSTRTKTGGWGKCLGCLTSGAPGATCLRPTRYNKLRAGSNPFRDTRFRKAIEG